ncbi:helix-turn-helix domain-containing protein [Nitriliruptoraceae bacterium ZYF776]|nr:helix-turn-helix domain-containing protein [Profundirhabdus halotolerans]
MNAARAGRKPGTTLGRHDAREVVAVGLGDERSTPHDGVDGPDELRERVAACVRELRGRGGHSLGELATAAGIGKSTLHAIEAGDANPSIETIWALARALGVPFGELLEPPRPAVRVLRAGEGTRVDSEGSTMTAHLLTATGRGARTEWFALELLTGPSRVATGHTPGTTEHVLVVAGRLRVGPDDQLVELGPGDLASFPGDVAHRYDALADGTRALLLLEYP